MSISVSRRSVFALRCSRDTATLVEWMTKGSILRARNQRANAADLAEIERAAAAIQVEGDRYPPQLQAMIGR